MFEVHGNWSVVLVLSHDYDSDETVKTERASRLVEENLNIPSLSNFLRENKIITKYAQYNTLFHSSIRTNTFQFRLSYRFYRSTYRSVRSKSRNRMDPTEINPRKREREEVVRGFNARYNSCYSRRFIESAMCARDENSHLTGRTIRLTYI